MKHRTPLVHGLSAHDRSLYGQAPSYLFSLLQAGSIAVPRIVKRKRPAITSCQAVTGFQLCGGSLSIAPSSASAADQHVLQVDIGVVAIQLGRLDQAHDGGGTLAAAQ